MQSEIVRFAPAPSGSLHLGNIRTALYNWFIAKKTNGKFILRIDDTNQKCTPEFLGKLQDDLNWLGIIPDEGPYFQSTRTERYREALIKLLRVGSAYHCYCKEEIQDCKCYLNRQDDIEKGYPIKFRCIVDESTIFDRVKGKVTTKNKYDPILWRSDGTPTYHLTSPIDDMDYGITLIIRGEDLLDSSFYQGELIKCLGGKVPDFAHLPLVTNSEGGKISKRDKSSEYTIKELRDEGYLPEAVINVLSLTGWYPGKVEFLTTEEIINNFLLENVSKASGRFDREKLDFFHIKHMKELSRDSFAVRMYPYLVEIFGQYPGKEVESTIINIACEDGWRLTEFSENLEFMKYCNYEVSFTLEELDIISKAANNLDTLSIDNGRDWVKSIGCSTRIVYPVLRKALTGKEKGIKFDDIFKILGILEVRGRLYRILVKHDKI